MSSETAFFVCVCEDLSIWRKNQTVAQVGCYCVIEMKTFPNQYPLFSPSLTVCSAFATGHFSQSMSRILPPHTLSLLSFPLPSHIDAVRQADSCCQANSGNRARENYYCKPSGHSAKVWGTPSGWETNDRKQQRRRERCYWAKQTLKKDE